MGFNTVTSVPVAVAKEPLPLKTSKLEKSGRLTKKWPDKPSMLTAGRPPKLGLFHHAIGKSQLHQPCKLTERSSLKPKPRRPQTAKRGCLGMLTQQRSLLKP